MGIELISTGREQQLDHDFAFCDRLTVEDLIDPLERVVAVYKGKILATGSRQIEVFDEAKKSLEAPMYDSDIVIYTVYSLHYGRR